MRPPPHSPPKNISLGGGSLVSPRLLPPRHKQLGLPSPSLSPPFLPLSVSLLPVVLSSLPLSFYSSPLSVFPSTYTFSPSPLLPPLTSLSLASAGGSLPAPAMETAPSLASGGDRGGTIKLLPPSTSARCSSCAALDSELGLFSVALPPAPSCSLFTDTNWTCTTLAPRMGALVSSLGNPRNATLLRRGLFPHADLLGVLVSPESAAVLNGTATPGPLTLPISRANFTSMISVRYGADDLLGVIYTHNSSLPVAAEFILWLRDLLGRNIDLVQLTKAAVCKCVDVAPSVEITPDGKHGGAALAGYVVHPLDLPQLGTSTPARSKHFCVEHWCGVKPHPDCCPHACLSPHYIFLHVPKTGGSSIECATTDWELDGRWTNMGHAPFHFVRYCSSRCGTTPRAAMVMTVRNPYDYWLSDYAYAKVCLGKKCSATAMYLEARNSTHVLATFDLFIRYIAAVGPEPLSQSAHIRRMCGLPCRPDYVLRTETLNADFLALLGTANFPLRSLPHINTARKGDGIEERMQEYTTDLADIVQQLEPILFSDDAFGFGYSRSLSR